MRKRLELRELNVFQVTIFMEATMGRQLIVERIAAVGICGGILLALSMTPALAKGGCSGRNAGHVAAAQQQSFGGVNQILQQRRDQLQNTPELRRHRAR